MFCGMLTTAIKTLMLTPLCAWILPMLISSVFPLQSKMQSAASSGLSKIAKAIAAGPLTTGTITSTGFKGNRPVRNFITSGLMTFGRRLPRNTFSSSDRQRGCSMGSSNKPQQAFTRDATLRMLH